MACSIKAAEMVTSALRPCSPGGHTGHRRLKETGDSWFIIVKGVLSGVEKVPSSCSGARSRVFQQPWRTAAES
jgi:hypothetical protein